MRKFTKALILFGIIIQISFSCVKEEDPPCACGVENPQENLEWLFIKLQSIILEQSGVITEIYSIIYQGQEYIGIYISGNISHNYKFYYDCAGNYICGYNGYDGEWSCDDDFTEAIKNEKLIYKKEND